MASVREVFLVARPDTSRFSPELQRYLRQLDPKVDVKVDADTTAFENTVRRLDRVVNAVKVAVELKLNQASLGAVDRQLKTLAKERFVKITPRINTNAYKAVMRDLAVLTAPRTVSIIADADTRVAADDLALLTRARTVTVDANANTAAAAAQLAALTHNQTVTINANVNAPGIAGIGGGGAGGGGPLGGLLKGLTSLPMVAGQALPAIASIGATLAQIGPAAAVGVAGLAAIKIATGVVKLGAMGMDDAFSAAFDPAKADEFQKALEKLAPSAQKFVLAVKGMKSGFDDVQKSVQQTLFSGWDKQLTAVGKSVLPTVKVGLKGTAGVLNDMGDSAFKAVANMQKMGLIKSILSGTNKALGNLKQAPGQLATAVAQIAAAAQPAFAQLTAAGGGAIKRITDAIDRLSKSGQLQQMINNAVTLLGQLGAMVGNVFSILGSVMSAAASAGGNAFGALGAVLQQVAQVAKMPEVQAALTSVFKLLSTVGQVIGSVVGPLLGAVIPALKPIADALVPIVTIVGNALKNIVTAITPLLAPIGVLIGEILSALMPVLGPVVDMIVGIVQQLSGPLMSIITALIPVVQMVGEIFDAVFGALTPLMQPLLGIIGQVASLISGVFVGALTALMPSIQTLIPVVVQIVTVLVQLLQSVLQPIMPLLQQLAPMFGQILLVAMQTLTPIIASVAGLFMQLLPMLMPLIPVIGQLVAAVMQLIPPLLNLTMAVLVPLMPVIVQVAGLLTTMLGAALQHIVPLVVNVIKWVLQLITGALNLLVPVINNVAKFFKAVLGPAFSWIAGVVKSLKTTLLDYWSKLWSGFKSILSGGLDIVKGIFKIFSGDFKGAVKTLKDGIGKIWSGIQSVFKAPVRFVVDTVYTAGIKKLWDTIAGKVGLPGLPAVRLPKGFAQGGVLPGMSSYGQGDSMLVPMRPGEGVYVSEAMKDPYERARLHAVNAAAMRGKPLAKFQGGFSKGGILGALGSGWDKLKGAGKWGLDKLGDIARGGLEMVAKPVLNGIKRLIDATLPKSPAWAGMMNSFAKKPVNAVLEWFRKDDKKNSGIGNWKPGAGVAQWSGVVRQALGAVGQPLSLVNTTLRRMNQESGGNPKAVNLWDSNAKAGHPSVGLMQVIKGTFDAYAGKYRGKGPKMYGVSIDPLANIYASMRYALSRYGSLASAYNRPGGYAKGGTPNKGEWAWVGENGPELMQFGSTSRVYSHQESMAMARNTTTNGPLIGTLVQQLPNESNSGEYANAMAFELRKIRMMGV